MSRTMITLCLYSTTILAVACGAKTPPTPRQEDLVDARILGIAPDPLIPQLNKVGETSQTVTLMVYAALPSNDDAVITPREVNGNAALAIDVMTVGDATYEDHSGFRLAKIPITAVVPDVSKFPQSGGATTSDGSSTTTSTTTTNQGGDISFGLTLTAGGQQEQVDGSFSAYADGSENLKWTAPVLTVSAPSDGGKVKADGQTVTLTYTQPEQEQIIVGWYTTAGQINDRTALSTTWIPGSSGATSLIGTIRGGRTHAFDLQILDVTAE